MSELQRDSNYVSKEEYNKLNKKLTKKVNLIASYEALLEQYNSDINTLKENLEKSNSLFIDVSEKFKNLNSTECSSCKDLKIQLNTLQNSNSDSISKESINNNISIKQFNSIKEGYIKRIEEIEVSYKELNYNFSLLSNKFNLIKEENLLLKEENQKLNHRLNSNDNVNFKKNDEYNRLYNEAKRLSSVLERKREIESCLIENTTNSLILNTKIPEKAVNLNNSNVNNYIMNNKNNNNNDKKNYIICEPVSSFVKFIALSQK